MKLGVQNFPKAFQKPNSIKSNSEKISKYEYFQLFIKKRDFIHFGGFQLLTIRFPQLTTNTTIVYKSLFYKTAYTDFQ